MAQGSDEVLRDLLGLHARIYRLFDEHTVGKERVASHWSPSVDIYETPDSLVLVAEVPGVNREDIHLETSDDRLLLRGERPLNTSDPDLSYYRIERPHGVFQRSFRLPPGVDLERIQASCRDGVLRITVPRGEPSQGRSIAVRVED